MRKLRNRRDLLQILLLAGLLALVNLIFRIPSSEGFNPGDDGVILAQSYRLTMGEIPHRDFFSIRPAGSAFMHLVHFLSPLPLQLSARWTVLAEYFLYSLLLALILVRAWFPNLSGSSRSWLLTGTTLYMFLLNENHYNLFPWTTIDAIFWFIVALYGWKRLRSRPGQSGFPWIFLVFFGVSFSALCRQTFLLPGLILGARALWFIASEVKDGRQVPGTGPDHRRRLFFRILAVAAGVTPAIAYAGIITIGGSWIAFLQQMTGRTEIWETGFARFITNFWHTPAWGLFIPVLFIGLMVRWRLEHGLPAGFPGRLLELARILTGAGTVVLSLAVFLMPDQLFSVSFGFFWLLVLQILILYLAGGRLPAWCSTAGWVLLVSWTSALSLGDNAPVFATGLLAGTGILFWVKTTSVRLNPYQIRVVSSATAILLAAILVLSFRVQKKVNYRDLPAWELTAELGEIFPGLGGIRSNTSMYDYLAEIKRIYREYGSPRGRFAVWPNNALIYKLLESPNPFMLDWMQSAEFPGNESRIMDHVRERLVQDDLVILVEKYNAKWLATDRVPLDTLSPDYPYLVLLQEYAAKERVDSPWFRVYRTR